MVERRNLNRLPRLYNQDIDAMLQPLSKLARAVSAHSRRAEKGHSCCRGSGQACVVDEGSAPQWAGGRVFLVFHQDRAVGREVHRRQFSIVRPRHRLRRCGGEEHRLAQD